MPVVIAAAPEVVIIALAAAIIAWALVQLLQSTLTGLAAYIPLVGRDVSTWVAGVISRAQSAANAWVQSSVAPLANAIAAPFQHLDTYFGGLETTFLTVAAVIGTLSGRIAQSSPDVMDSKISTAVDQAEDKEDQKISSLQTALGQEKTAATAYTDQQAAAVRNEATAQLDQAGTNLRAYTDQKVATVAATAAAAAAAADAAKGDAERAQTQVASLQQQVGALNPSTVAQQIASAVAVAEQAATTQGARLADEIASAAAVATAAGASAAAVDTALQQLVSDCAEPMCSAFGGEMQLTNSLNGLLTDGVIAALLAAILADQQGAAQVIASAVAPIAQTAMDGLKALANV